MVWYSHQFKEVKQVLINYDNGQHVVDGVQRDGRRGGKKDIGMASIISSSSHV